VWLVAFRAGEFPEFPELSSFLQFPMRISGDFSSTGANFRRFFKHRR
jgi:hypothetical protein